MNIKRYVAFLLIATTLALGSLTLMSPSKSYAHVLLPENVITYINENPDASPEEINKYIQGNSTYLSEKIKNQQDVVNIVHQKTSFFDNAYDFLKLGMHHILSGPDHVLFVLSLLLVFTGIGSILKFTGTFTIAHSITLILAGSGLLTLSSDIVEPIIALSIAVVAISTVFFKDNKYLGDIRTKLGIVFFFGLFHGLGFAGLLQEIQVPEDKFLFSLISFNIGVELGQLLIVLIPLPFIYFFRNKKYYQHSIKVIAASIATVALYWMVQRIIG